MTEREMLELAAKAAGIELRVMAVKPAPPEAGDGFIGFMTDPDQWPRGWFNPLADDGDSRRLEVRLRLDVWHGKWPNGVGYVAAQRIWHANDSLYYDDGVAHGDDPCAATRLAVLRAAAEIGKTMP